MLELNCKRGIYLQISSGGLYFLFWWSEYSRHWEYDALWRGICMSWEFPWETVPEGDLLPHGFMLITDLLPLITIESGF